MSTVRTRLARKMKLARLVLWWERLWRQAWPVPAILILFVAFAGFDVLPRLPGWLHALVLVAFIGSLGWALWRLRRVRRPTIVEARRRLEQDSNLPHRPLALLADKLASGAGDPFAQALWQEQRRRYAAMLSRLRLAPPRPDLPRHDPLGLRFVPVLLLAIALAGGWHDLPARLARSLVPAIGPLAGPSAQLQVWITPPDYTRIAPILLQGQQADSEIKVPQGSKLLAELQGGHGDAALAIGDSSQPFQRLDSDSQRLNATLTASGEMGVRQGWWKVAQWTLSVIPNTPPAIAFSTPPTADPQGRLKLDVAGQDQYGVTKSWVTIRRPDAPDAPPVVVELPLPGGQPTTLKSSSTHDLTANPWAGLKVTMQPGALDAAGLTGQGGAVTLTMPERQFTNPIARAVIALRKSLVLNPGDRTSVAYGLSLLMTEPGRFGGDLVVFLGLSDSLARLRMDQGAGAVPSVIDTLWQTALRIEDGSSPSAQREIDAARQALDNALASHAPQADIDRLTQNLQDAINRYLQALAQQAPRQDAQPLQPGQQYKVYTQQDINNMIKRLSDLARTGSPDAARQALADLAKLLDQLRNAQMVSPGPNSGQAQQTMQSLNSIMQGQRNLLDQTFRNGNGGDQQGDAAAAQEALRKRLGDAMQALGDMGAGLPQELGQAEQSMRAASQALRDGDAQGALNAQAQALAHLQAGMSAAQQALAPETGNLPDGPGQGHDPLGRPLVGGAGTGDDGSVQIPTQSEVQKSREVLDELRRRAGDGSRPPPERDYLNRLLQQFQ